jgi:cytoskeletal protein RodZ
METPGNILKAEREKQKKSYEDIANTLRINTEYLKAIEKDNYQLLPADVFTKSYLRLYSEALGLESDHILNLYKEQFGTPVQKEPEPAGRTPRRILPRLKFNYIYLVIICIGLATVSVTAYTKHGTEKPDTVTAKDATANEAEPIDITMPEAAEEAKHEDLSLKIAAGELTWVSVRIDSTKAMDHLLRAGETMTFKAHEKFVLKIGNAGGMSIFFNGIDIGPLGSSGQVIDIVLP